MIKLLQPFLTVANIFVKILLRSRLHWLLSGNVVLLVVVGRKSGKAYLVPVNYRRSDGGISVMTYRRRQWWRNIETGSQLPVYFRGKLVPTRVEVVTDDEEAIARGLIERGWMRKSIAPAKAHECVLLRLKFGPSDESS